MPSISINGNSPDWLQNTIMAGDWSAQRQGTHPCVTKSPPPQLKCTFLWISGQNLSFAEICPLYIFLIFIWWNKTSCRFSLFLFPEKRTRHVCNSSALSFGQ
ncbi:hypothetical protein XENTR_v10007295 [Xenopus tropicalis]|nr:hypothetical protein XENTR_v10007295 [Xenopus tropicalis]